MLSEFKLLGAGLNCSGLGGVGQRIDHISSSLVEAMSVNPSLRKSLFSYTLSDAQMVSLFIATPMRFNINSAKREENLNKHHPVYRVVVAGIICAVYTLIWIIWFFIMLFSIVCLASSKHKLIIKEMVGHNADDYLLILFNLTRSLTVNIHMVFNFHIGSFDQWGLWVYFRLIQWESELSFFAIDFLLRILLTHLLIFLLLAAFFGVCLEFNVKKRYIIGFFGILLLAHLILSVL